MKTYKFSAAHALAAGTIVYLTGIQADKRAHLIRPQEAGKVHKNGRNDGTRLPFVSDRMLNFKAGDEIGLDAVPDEATARALGATMGEDTTDVTPGRQIKSTKAVKANQTKAVKEAVARAEVAEAERDAMRLQLVDLGTRLVAADAQLEAAEKAVAEAGEDADIAVLDAAVKAGEDELGAVEQEIAVFLKGFVVPEEKDKESAA